VKQDNVKENWFFLDLSRAFGHRNRAISGAKIKNKDDLPARIRPLIGGLRCQLPDIQTSQAYEIFIGSNYFGIVYCSRSVGGGSRKVRNGIF
jgi:hypothetical protein